MTGWHLFPGGRDIFETHGNRQGKKIGEFSHFRAMDSEIVGVQVKGGPEMKIFRDTITVDGYEKPWIAVTPMNTNPNRLSCAAWVWQLICEGTFESHKEAV